MTVLEMIIASLNDSKNNKFNFTYFDDIVIININDNTLPVILVVSDTQITLVCNLFRINEVRAENKLELLEAMHRKNLPLNLSSFSQSGEYHIIFGALSIDSSIHQIETEILTLIYNAEESLLLFEKYLILK